MVQSRDRRFLVRLLFVAVLAMVFGTMLVALVGCNNGDTDGGSAADGLDNGDPFVSDGGAGASLKITPLDDEIEVGEIIGYFVTVLDPRGAPIPFTRIFCESEKGLAIIEPSSGGVAFEHTGADGKLSGKLGGLLPGSFIFECRAPEGFNLVDRVTIIVRGEVPLGFQGFPGAAGGNLGGGVIVDQTPSVDDGTGLRVTGVSFQDAGPDGGLQLDVCQGTCTSGSTTTIEPFSFTNYNVTVTNGTAETVLIDSIRFEIQDSGPDSVVSSQGQAVELAKGASTTISGSLTNNICTPTTTSGACYAGSNTLVEPGTWNVLITIKGETLAGEEFTVEKTVSITWAYVNNCASGSTPGAGATC